MLIIILSIIIILLLLSIVIFLNHIFVSEFEIKKICDESYFFKRMSSTDLYVRDTPNVSTYLREYKTSLCSFTLQEKVLLYKYIKKANIILKKYTKLYNIPWKFAKIKNKESNYPHTLFALLYATSRYNL